MISDQGKTGTEELTEDSCCRGQKGNLEDLTFCCHQQFLVTYGSVGLLLRYYRYMRFNIKWQFLKAHSEGTGITKTVHSNWLQISSFLFVWLHSCSCCSHGYAFVVYVQSLVLV